MREPLGISRRGGRLHIEGYPDAVALKRIDDPIARQLQATVLHCSDLRFCNEALAALSAIDRKSHSLTAEALWVAAIARYFKCFGGNKSRAQLSAKKVLKGEDGAEDVFVYCQHLRDKHFIHDENAYSQSFTAVALNPQDAPFKVADVISMVATASTLDEQHIESFARLARFTLSWVERKRDELHSLLGAQYERESYEALLNLTDVEYQVPTSDKVSVAR
jgi:hypothetical protein